MVSSEILKEGVLGRGPEEYANQRRMDHLVGHGYTDLVSLSHRRVGIGRNQAPSD